MTSRTARWAEPPLRGRTVRDEIRANLIGAPRLGGRRSSPASSATRTPSCPSIVNALLARHHFILLGLRGQAKSRILRELTALLDERDPGRRRAARSTTIPFAPISQVRARDCSASAATRPRSPGCARDQRYVEKLATPDVTIADIIGDVDPIKAARGGHLLSDELTMHFGLLPRANRGIFAINELPDLSGKIQVGLFNIMQEGDVQIKGYPVRLPLDVLLVLHREPRGLHRARQDHHAAQGPDRLGDHHPLSRAPSSSAWRSPRRRRGSTAAAGRSTCPTSCSR